MSFFEELQRLDDYGFDAKEMFGENVFTQSLDTVFNIEKKRQDIKDKKRKEQEIIALGQQAREDETKRLNSLYIPDKEDIFDTKNIALIGAILASFLIFLRVTGGKS